MKKSVISIIAVIILLAGDKLFFLWTAAENPKPTGENYRDDHKIINNFRKQLIKISVISESSNYAFLSY